jgi:DNA polymerase III delta subunit
VAARPGARPGARSDPASGPAPGKARHAAAGESRSGSGRPAFLNRAAAERAWQPAKIKSRAFLIAGTDPVALVDLRRELIRRYGGENVSDLSRTDFDAALDPPGLLLDALREISLFGGCNVIVVQRAEKALDAAKFGDLVSLLDELDDRTLLILHSDVAQRDLAGKPLVDRLLDGQAAAYCYAPLTEEDGVRWVSEYCARRGRSIARNAAAAVVARAGLEPGELASELEKLLFAAEGEAIEAGEVEALLGDHRERESFDWADAVMNGERRAMALVGRVLRSPRESAGMIGAIQSRLDDLEALAAGKFLPILKRRAAERAMRKWDAGRIADAREILLRVDLDLKSHPEDQAAARLELATLKLLEE